MDGLTSWASYYLSGTHLGLERTLEPVTDKYYWVGISRTARDYIRQCLVCLERNPRLGHGSISGAASVTDGSYDDGSSITGEDTLSLSGTEVVSTSGDADPFYEQYSVFTRETAKTFWEMVSLQKMDIVYCNDPKFSYRQVSGNSVDPD